MSLFANVVHGRWIPKLPESFANNGLDVIAVDHRREVPSQRQAMLENHCHVVQGKALGRVRRGLESQEWYADILDAVDRTVSASRRGGYYAITSQVVVGRKERA